jgi:phage terminase large subunit GpA-like protein
MSKPDRTAELDGYFRFPQPDRSAIYEWARKHVVLPESYAMPGKFDVRHSPWLVPIFDALRDDGVRSVTVSKSIQSGGTLIADVWVPWLIVNAPGPISWTMHTDDMVERHAKSRLNPILERCEPVARLLPRPGPMRTQTEIYFGGFFMLLNSANLSDQQSQSIRYKINDEIWHKKWQDIYKEAVGRVTKFEEMGTSKILNISQGGWEDDVSDLAWRGGHMAEWSARCPACSKLHPLAFRQFMACDAAKPEKERKRAGVVWAEDARLEGGVWNVARAMESVRFRCPECGHESDDSDATRERWKRSGEYVVTRADAPPSAKSFHFEALPTRPMRLLAQQFCEAENEFTKTGSDEARRVFRQKREARAWVEERQTLNIITLDSDYTLETYWNGEPVPGEAARFMTVDRQQTHFWVEVAAWTAAPEYTQLYFGGADTIDQVREIQRRYRVPDSCVGQDRRYDPDSVDRDCVRFGWRGLMGYKKKTWTMKNEATGLMENYPHSDPKFSSVGPVPAPFYEFSSHHCKDVVANAVNGRSFKWRLPKNVNPLYLDYLKGEEKKETRPGVWEWVEVKQNANHSLDTSAMMVCIAIIAGLVRFTLEKES